jgi:hypothetical protein
VLVSLDDKKKKSAYLVLGVTQSVEKLVGALARRVAAGGSDRAAVVFATLLPFRGRIVSNGFIEATPEVARVTPKMRAAAESPAAALPDAPPPDLAPFAAWRKSDAASNANEPPADAEEARSLEALAAQPRPRARGAWTLRRLGYTEAEGDNPNKLVSVVFDDGTMGGMAECARIEPTVAELLALLADVRRKTRALPECVFVDAANTLPRIAVLLKRALGPPLVVFYYTPPSPEESRRIEAAGPPGCPQQ